MDPSSSSTSGRGLKRPASPGGAPTDNNTSDGGLAFVPLHVRRERERERLEEVSRQTAAAHVRRLRAAEDNARAAAIAAAAANGGANGAAPPANPDSQKTLMQIQQELLLERGGVHITDEERLRAEEQKLLENLSMERAPLLGRKQVAGTGEVFTQALETGWRPPRHVRTLPQSAHTATRAKFGITLEGGAAEDASVPPPITKFAHMRLPPAILAALNAKGIHTPSPIQMQGLPVVLSGRDMIGIALTGSGKTLVFTLPMVVFALQAEAVQPLARGEGPVGLVIVPSRELAVQHAALARHFAAYVNAATGACPPPEGAIEAGLVPPAPLDLNSIDHGGASAPGGFHSNNNNNNQQSRSQQQYAAQSAQARAQGQTAGSGALRFPQVGKISVITAIGGVNMAEEYAGVAPGCGVHIVVATPGRLVGMLEQKKLSMARCVYLAMDEADRLVDMGFEESMRAVFDAFPHQRQTVLFSATMPKKIQEFALTALVEPVVVNVGRAGRANMDVIQEVEYVKQEAKSLYLLECLQKTPPPVIVFAEKQSTVDHIHEYLLLKGVDAAAVHGGRGQEERTRAIKEFETGVKDVLVATDVAAKGLDFPAIQHVINYDMPKEIENYIHRIGRTGRSGKTGVATSFVNRDCEELFLLDLKHLLKEARQKIPPVLSALEDPSEFVGADGDETRVCEYCDGRGHRVIECPKLQKKNKAMKNTYGYDMVEDQS